MPEEYLKPQQPGVLSGDEVAELVNDHEVKIAQLTERLEKLEAAQSKRTITRSNTRQENS